MPTELLAKRLRAEHPRQVHKMLPMTLGANIGTTFTALLAALAVPTHDSLQIAFCGAALEKPGKNHRRAWRNNLDDWGGC